MWFVKEIGDPHLLVIHWIFKSRDNIGHLGDEDHEQENMGDVELPGSAQSLYCGITYAVHCERTTIDQGSRVT